MGGLNGGEGGGREALGLRDAEVNVPAAGGGEGGRGVVMGGGQTCWARIT